MIRQGEGTPLVLFHGVLRSETLGLDAPEVVASAILECTGARGQA